jgi:hypothetical protein
MHPSISAPLLVVVCSFFTVATSPSLRRRAGGAFSPGRVIRRVEIDADARPSRAPPTQPLVSACFLVRLPSSTPDRRRFQFPPLPSRFPAIANRAYLGSCDSDHDEDEDWMPRFISGNAFSSGLQNLLVPRSNDARSLAPVFPVLTRICAPIDGMSSESEYPTAN